MNFPTTIKLLLVLIIGAIVAITSIKAAPQYRYVPQSSGNYNYPRYIPGYSNYAPFSGDYDERNTDAAYSYYTNLLRRSSASRNGLKSKLPKYPDYEDYATLHASFG